MLQAGDSVDQATLCVAGRRAGGPGDGWREVEALVVPDDLTGLDGPLGGAFDGSSTACTAGNPQILLLQSLLKCVNSSFADVL